MERETEATLRVLAHSIRFATDHPYAATGIFGAAVGSVVTYKVMTFSPQRPSVRKMFTPKVYEIALPPEDLHRLLDDPTYELRWETAEAAVIVTAEKHEPMKQLPIIDGTIVE